MSAVRRSLPRGKPLKPTRRAKTGSRRSCEFPAVVIVGGCNVMVSTKSGRAESYLGMPAHAALGRRRMLLRCIRPRKWIEIRCELPCT
jgi:hypothetical protein